MGYMRLTDDCHEIDKKLEYEIEGVDDEGITGDDYLHLKEWK